MNCAEFKELLVTYVEGLLDERKKRLVTEHLKDCAACQAELKDLTDFRNRLVKNGSVLAQSDLEDDVMNQIAREQNARLRAARKAGTALKLRRIIMKSPITRLAAAAVIIIAVLIALNPIRPSITFAQVIEPILNSRAMIYDFLVGDEATSPIMHEIIVGQRIRRTISNRPGMTMVIDLESSKMLVMTDHDKTAAYVDIQGPLRDRTQNYVKFLRQVITKLRDNYEELGEQEIEGRKTIAFRAVGRNEAVKIWADPKTALPVRIELTLGQLFVILKNFQFDPLIDETLMSMEVPAGYTLEKTDIDFTDVDEQDFIESLRIWAEVIGDGTFPDAIGTENAMKDMYVLGVKIETSDLPEEEASQLGVNFGKGMLFHQLLETQGRWHYAGAGVKLGEASKAIFWYQPEDSETYRVIYGDLHVEDVEVDKLPK